MTTLMKSTVAATAMMMAAAPVLAGSLDAPVQEPVITTAPTVVATGARLDRRLCRCERRLRRWW